MPRQPDLFASREPEPVGAAREARDEAIGRIERNAQPSFIDVAESIARRLATRGGAFSSCDVRDAMAAEFPDVETHDERALGPVMVRLAKEGAIERVGHRPSGRARNHNRPVMFWRGTWNER